MRNDRGAHLADSCICPSSGAKWLSSEIVGPWHRQLLGGIVSELVDNQDEFVNSMSQVYRRIQKDESD